MINSSASSCVSRPATLSVGDNDVNKIVESVVSLVENQATAQSVSIERNLQKNLPKVSVDGEQIKQVLLNLAIKSLQAMQDGGKLFFRTLSGAKFCVAEVGDTGSGIDEKIARKIFDPFFTTKEKGVGLGLSIAHKIISQHNGSLSVESKNGNTVFALHLPENQ